LVQRSNVQGLWGHPELIRRTTCWHVNCMVWQLNPSTYPKKTTQKFSPMNGIIILAAGGASRLGKPKQLLAYRDKTLLKNLVDEAIRSETGPVWVVLGTEKARVAAGSAQEIMTCGTPLVLINEEWQEGMASSIRKGLSGILKTCPELDAVILAVSDQPFVSASLFRDLTTHKQGTAKGIIACAYKDTLGTPVLFDRKYFPQLLELEGQEGAKKLISQYSEDVSHYPFDLGEIDLDRPEDYFFLQ
jgi:molybdenum cofactor cytidylyltransferase